ncbi:MAG: hypothetical protein Q9170_004761 [Blastenia crenularia]
MQLVDWLDDLCVRFIINLPQEELQSVERICFQVEEAQWYYEDFIRPLDPDLPSLNLRNFCLRIFQHCPLLSEFSPYHHATAFEEFLAYKTRVPVRGAIMLNDEMDEVILVKGWKKGANWSFPRGKINKDESDLACAIREVYEETGYDVEAAGLVRQPEAMKYIDVAIQHQHIRLYVFRGVPVNTPFEARTRKEISKIDWWKLSDLPTLKKKKQQTEGRGEDVAVNANKFYMVAPFLVPLKKWISQQKKMDRSKNPDQLQYPDPDDVEELPTDDGGLNGTDAVGISEDMERLFDGMRGRGQAPFNINAPAPKIKASTDEASSQLKKLLRVPVPKASDLELTQSAPTSAEEKRASTLLALLRGGPTTRKTPALQTPLGQTIPPPSTPEAPKPNHAAPSRLSAIPPPSGFPFALESRSGIDRDGVAKPDNIEVAESQPADVDRASVAAWNNFETTSAKQEVNIRRALAEEANTGVQPDAALPVINETWRQIKVDRNTNMGQADPRQISNVLKRSVGGRPETHQAHNEPSIRQDPRLDTAAQHAPAPYQVTSSVQAAVNSQHPDNYRPAIPAANKLPMPKLTAHSSSLLNLFKNGQAPIATPGVSKASVVESRVHSQTPTATAEKAVEHKSVKGALGRIPVLDSRSPRTDPSTTQISTDLKRPQGAHQAALLDLFRKSSLSGTEPAMAPQKTLDIPADVVELSAMPSPGHSREPSKADVEEPRKLFGSVMSKPLSIQKRPPVPAKDGRAPVFATVNGPLNVPQFEMIASNMKGKDHVPAAEKQIKKSPVTILARPASAKAKPSPDQPGKPNVDVPQSNPSTVLKAGTHKTQTPMPKQILRRPTHPEKSAPAQQRPIPPSQPPVHKRETPSPLSAFERPPSLKPDHKATLLSLFTKPSSPGLASGPPSRPDLSAFISPVIAKPPSFFPAPPNGTNDHDAARSRMSSVTIPSNGVGVGADGDVSGSAEVRQTPKKMTSDVDRNFLLGYLEGVARKEGK